MKHGSSNLYPSSSFLLFPPPRPSPLLPLLILPPSFPSYPASLQPSSFLLLMPHASQGGSKRVGPEEGQKEGYGCYYWTDDSVYQGRWTDNVIDGAGAYTASDGRSFAGQWKESVIHGLGKYTWPGGREYRGAYVADQKHGFGIFTWPDGRKYTKYVGYWANGKQSGAGTYTTKDGGTRAASPSQRREG
ncbi:unnamed protein product [Prorocentrum cordatum]|uniref:MORN repeat-containing protein 5 n=1 Tax=Prorocentrum cordatum TaxID=2364126 RepID=A0ABN9UG75_9DINO|nr:unnamed protein product [Polarella glacialis]